MRNNRQPVECSFSCALNLIDGIMSVYISPVELARVRVHSRELCLRTCLDLVDVYVCYAFTYVERTFVDHNGGQGNISA